MVRRVDPDGADYVTIIAENAPNIEPGMRIPGEMGDAEVQAIPEALSTALQDQSREEYRDPTRRSTLSLNWA
jgi:hypothetical protein